MSALTSLLLIILIFALVGFTVYLITEYIPMPAVFRQVIIVATVVVLILYLLGLVTGRATMPIVIVPK